MVEQPADRTSTDRQLSAQAASTGAASSGLTWSILTTIPGWITSCSQIQGQGKLAPFSHRLAPKEGTKHAHQARTRITLAA